MNDSLALICRTARIFVWLLCGFACCYTAGCGRRSDTITAEPGDRQTVPGKASTAKPTESRFDRDEEIEQSDALLEAGQFSQAASVLQRVLMANPNDVEVLFRFAQAKAAGGNLDEAVAVLDSIPIDHPEAGLAAIGQAADWCFALNRFDDAEQRYLKILQRVPNAAIAHRQLAYLLNRQGRRHEAAEHIRQLCRIGDVREDELHALMSLSDAIYDDPQKAHGVPAGTRPYWPIGASGEARKLFTDREYEAAANLLHDQVEKQSVPPSVNAFYGLILIEAQDEQRFLSWLVRADESTRQFAEYWAAVGAYLIGNQRFDEAVRALGEAIRRDPTDARSMRRIYQALTAVGEDEAAKKCFDHYVIARDVTLASNQIGASKPPELERFSDIVRGLIDLERPLEAVLWEMVEAFYAKRPKNVVAEIGKRRMSLASAADAFPRSTIDRFGIDLDNFPLPELEQMQADSPSPKSPRAVAADSVGTPSFQNVADQIGLDHQYWVASTLQGSAFSIYQSVGGGVVVTDFDLDGFVDLYFAQGGTDPPEYVGSQSNVLYRTTDGQLRDVSEMSGTAENRYSIGLTCGDWNQDGFPDLVVANMGANTLLINNGDGTFSSSVTDQLDDPTIMSTSVAIADVTGDAIADIVELNYAHDETLPKKPQRKSNGELSIVGPFEFKPGTDRVLVNDGQGVPEVHSLNETADKRATGLGVVVADFDGEPGNETFIGNDLRADQLYTRDESGKLRDIATTTGCAFASNGARTATMGIAAGDFDNTGTLDLHLTNFEKEPATLLLNRGKTFQDRAIQFKLVADSYPLVGFGCQAIDYDNDGKLDIIVTNGHVENTGGAGQPFQQPPQLFANLGDRFQRIEVDDPSGYFDEKHVGRALARLDFNRDGKSDYVLTHIESRSALLINRSETGNHWLAIQLVGTSSERDAIGAKVQVRADGQEWTRWVTAGDGYLCRNEQTLSFGLGAAMQVAQMVVTWPDGSQQTFQGLNVDQRVMVIQGQQDLFSFSESFD